MGTTTFKGNVAYVEGIAFWSPTLPNWDAAQAAFRQEAQVQTLPARLPSAELLAAAERRRAPETVVMALHVGAEAAAMSGLDPRDLKSVFASAHGDLAVTDAMCQTLARSPAHTSPTKFHHSVHNAASGYWSMATNCLLASTAISAKSFTFATGLMESLCQCTADACPVLTVGYDIGAIGPLATVIDSRGALAVALVLSPVRTVRSRYLIEWALVSWASLLKGSSTAALEAGLAETGLADALPFFETLAGAASGSVLLPLSEGTSVFAAIEDLSLAEPVRARA